MRSNTDWLEWYKGYDVSADRQARLRFVQTHIGRCLDACEPGPIQVVSLCAGDGRDLIGMLPQHKRQQDVVAWLVEMNLELVARGRDAIENIGLDGRLRYVVGDATLSSTYLDIAPARVIVVAGVLGNLRQLEVPRLIGNLSALCTIGAFVVWTRHLQYNEGARQLPVIRQLLHDAAFEEVSLDTTSEAGYAVGTHRYLGSPRAIVAAQKWFEFGGVE